MTNKFIFQILTSQCSGSFDTQLLNLEKQLALWMIENSLCLDQLISSRVYLTDAANQLEKFTQSVFYKEAVSKAAVSYIEQPLLDGSKVAIQLWFATGVQVVKDGTPDCMRIKIGELCLLFQSVRFQENEVRGWSAEEQTEEAFRRHMAKLSDYKMNLEQHCHRTWLYVRDIDRHYAGVVTARNHIFEENGLTSDTHYISSTGIGGYADNRESIVGIDFLSVDGLDRHQVKYLHALDYLNPTHEYGVAFERGTRLSLPQGELSLISGTASIDKHGVCLHQGDVLTQTGRLFLNIEKLLEDGESTLSDMQYMIVYLRDISDYQEVAAYLNLRFPHIPFLITEARVCRPEWLIEVECMAMKYHA